MCVERMALTPALWEQIISGLTVEETARLGGASHTHLRLMGGYEWLQQAHGDFYVQQHRSDVEEQEYIPQQADQRKSDDEVVDDRDKGSLTGESSSGTDSSKDENTGTSLGSEQGLDTGSALEGLQGLCAPQDADNVLQVEVGTWAGALQEQTQLWMRSRILHLPS